ncbi:hypothetical protein FRC19_011745 [Serendipita sp. 401]|nr:hypothetical protein FRC19_011745 [Serendipita sp. 401]
MFILKNNDPSLEGLSKYKKRGFELEIAQNQLKALEELYSTTKTSLDASNSLYELFVHPVIDCLCKDIEIYTQYVQNAEQDLARITFPSGPRAEASIIEQALDAVKRLYPEYSDSCTAVLKLPPPSPPKKRLSSEDIEHRRIAAKLHPKQKVARTHFETSYPKLLGDHMEYMEQVRSLVWDNTTRRSELSTTIACNANAEKVFIDRFSTADAIAVPYEKLELEQSRSEYQHAPVVNPLTRNLEEVPIVILGRDIDSGSEEDFAAELLVACLERYLVAPYRDVHACPEDSWATIRRMESSQNIQSVYDIVSSLPHSGVVEKLLEVVMMNSGMSVPLLNLTNQTSAKKLRGTFTNLVPY